MKIILTFLALVISTALVAQNNSLIKQTTNTVPVTAVSSNEKNKDKKVHYVEKRTKPVQNSLKGNSNSQGNKKPVVRKSENQGKTVSK